MLKIENEEENYDFFDIKFKKKKRIKISTFKVIDSGKGIGEIFMKLILEYAQKNNIDEIYITIFPKYKKLISL